VTPAFEHMLRFGEFRNFTAEDLEKAVHLDPSQIAKLGPSLASLREMLEERKRRILETYETDHAQQEAAQNFRDQTKATQPPGKLSQRFQRAVREEQLYDLEQLWYQTGDERGKFARDLLQLIERL